MPSEQKKCPLCAEEIPLAATTCEFCGAVFDVTGTGYCQNCHAMRAADENGHCKVCGGMVMDLRLESKFKGESPVSMESIPPVPVPPAPVPLHDSPAPARLAGNQASGIVVLPIKGEGVNLRWSAVFLDFLIIGFVYSVVTMVILLVVGGGMESLTQFDMDAFMSNYGGVVLLPFPVIWFLYFFICEAAFAATPGKAASYLRVIRKGGGRIRWWQAAVRALLGIFEYNLIAAIVIWSTPLRQRLGDLLAGTLVVQKDKVHQVKFMPPAITIEFHDYRQVEFAQITEGILYKFGRIRQLALRGLSRDGNPVKLTLNGVFFRPEFDMLCLNIEQRYGLRFPEKIIIWRLIVLMLDLLFVLAATVSLVLVLLNRS